MYKGSINLCRINKSMKLVFNLILKGDDAVITSLRNKKDNDKLIRKYLYNQNEYLKLNPYPYINIDISDTSDKNDAWNSNTVLSLNRYGLFLFIREIERILPCFDEENLFLKNKEGIIYVNRELVIDKKYYSTMRFPNGKAIKIIPSIIRSGENSAVETEDPGVIFCINSDDNFCNITKEELEYLLFELKQINMQNLSLLLLLSDLVTNPNIQKELSPEKIEINFVKPEEKDNSVITTLPKQISVIPDI